MVGRAWQSRELYIMAFKKQSRTVKGRDQGKI
jgi:hypothetical protein